MFHLPQSDSKIRIHVFIFLNFISSFKLLLYAKPWQPAMSGVVGETGGDSNSVGINELAGLFVDQYNKKQVIFLLIYTFHSL